MSKLLHVNDNNTTGFLQKRQQYLGFSPKTAELKITVIDLGLNVVNMKFVVKKS